MPATTANPDELQDQRELKTFSKGLDQAFVFRRSTVRDRQAIDRLMFEWSGGARWDAISENSKNLYEMTATLQTVMISPGPAGYDLAAQEDAESEIAELYGTYVGWKARFRQSARAGAGATGGA